MSTIRTLEKAVKKCGGFLEQDFGGRWDVWQCVAPSGMVWKAGRTKHLRVEWAAGVSTSRAARESAVKDALERVGRGLADATAQELFENES